MLGYKTLEHPIDPTNKLSKYYNIGIDIRQ